MKLCQHSVSRLIFSSRVVNANARRVLPSLLLAAVCAIFHGVAFAQEL